MEALHTARRTMPGNRMPSRLGALLGLLLRQQAGSVAIETALSFTMTMTMVFGIMEMCMMGYTYSVLEDSAREGVRYASVHGKDSSSCSGPSTGCADSSAANVVSDVKNFGQLFSGSLPGMVVTVTYPDSSCAATSRVQVAISYTYQPVFHFPGTSHQLQVSSQGRILY